jgi:putative oxidoreductase
MFDALAKNTLVPLILRLGLAVIFIYHGMHKVMDEGNELGAAWAKPQAAKAGEDQKTMPRLMQMAVAWGELIGGIALALGFLTRLAAVGIGIIMIGAIYNVHGEHGFGLPKGYEYNFAILVMCAGVILLGGGALAADRLFRVRPRNPVAVR